MSLRMPVSGVIWRKNWSRDSGSLGNCEPSLTTDSPFSHRPMRNWVYQRWSRGVVLMVPLMDVAPASPRRGWSIRNTLWPMRRNMSDQPSRPSGVVIQPMRDWP